MQLPIPKDVTVSLMSSGQHIRFSSTDEKVLCNMAEDYAKRKGLNSVGAIRVTHCNITALPGNYEPDLGVPSPHFMILVSHQDLAFAGDREPQTTTVYRTMRYSDNGRGDARDPLVPEYTYHFTAELK